MERPDSSAHRRFNPLTGEHVLVSPHRSQRPWQGKVESSAIEARPSHDPQCYLCPGNERANGSRNPDYEGTFVFDNDFSALQPNRPQTFSDVTGLRVATTEYGRCRVVCFSPRHDLTLAALSAPDIVRVIDAWVDEVETLGADPDVNHVQIFENKGEIMGCSNPHPHGQIWAQSSIPGEAAKEIERQREYFEANRRTLLGDYLNAELDDDERIVCANDAFVALVPFWATWPFETLVLPRMPLQSLAGLPAPLRHALASVISQLTRAYDKLFDVSFPYSAGIHQAPTDGNDHPWITLHLHFFPPLLRSANVKKFMVGYEMMAEAQRDLTPEEAAGRLRECALP